MTLSLRTLILLFAFVIAAFALPAIVRASSTFCYPDGCLTLGLDGVTRAEWDDSVGIQTSLAQTFETIFQIASNTGHTFTDYVRDATGRIVSLACVNGSSWTASYNSSAPPPPPPPPPPPTCSITLDKNPIAWGETTKIHWSSARTAVFYINSIGYVAGSGSVNVSPLGTTDYSGHVNDAADGSGQAGQCAATLVVTGGQCPPGQILRAGICISQCPVGYTYQNGSCVFLECPSGYVKQGTSCVLSTACAAPPHCEANDLVNSCTGETIQVCDWGCTAGACKAIPPPAATLKAVPALVHSGNITTVSWSSTNAASCSVHGSNGDSWTGISSTGETSSPIQGQTIYTLHCIGVSGSNPPTIDKSATLNVIPVFNEQ